MRRFMWSRSAGTFSPGQERCGKSPKSDRTAFVTSFLNLVKCRLLTVSLKSLHRILTADDSWAIENEPVSLAMCNLASRRFDRSIPWLAANSMLVRRPGYLQGPETSEWRKGMAHWIRRWAVNVDGIRHWCRESRRFPGSFRNPRARKIGVDRVGRQWLFGIGRN